MKNKKVGTALLSTLLATAYTVPGMACAGDQAKNAPQAGKDQAKPAVASQALRQEVIQLILKENSDFASFNIAGLPGIRYRIYYSLTGKDDSYKMAPESEGVIGDNGTGSIGLKVGKLGMGDVYLKVKTSDKADFSESLTMAEPFVLAVTPIEERSFDKSMTTKGLAEDDKKKDDRNVVEKVIDKVKAEVKQHVKDPVRTPSAVAGVRG
jgi:hypothetical protein